MQADRELLEMAAKAARYDVEFDSDGLGCWFRGKTTAWRPLFDDGDVLRLAAKLRINIDFNDCCAWNRGVFGLVQEFWGGDFDPCYRRAIVRAAAAIGEGMG